MGGCMHASTALCGGVQCLLPHSRRIGGVGAGEWWAVVNLYWYLLLSESLPIGQAIVGCTR